MVCFIPDDPVHIAGWQVDVVWVERASWHDLFNFYNASSACSGDVWVEITSSLSEDNIPFGICFPRLYE